MQASKLLSSACVCASSKCSSFPSPDPNGTPNGDGEEKREVISRGQAVLAAPKHHHGAFLTRIISLLIKACFSHPRFVRAKP